MNIGFLNHGFSVKVSCGSNKTFELDIVGTVHHLVIYMQSNKIHKVIFNE